MKVELYIKKAVVIRGKVGIVGKVWGCELWVECILAANFHGR